MQHTMRTRLAGVFATGGLVMAALAVPTAALASRPIPTHQVTICHATASATNPYVMITVDVTSTGELERGHTGHAGPLWDATLKGEHLAWGDIIPAYSHGGHSFPGQNLLGGGQAILDAGCSTPGDEPDGDEPAQPADEPTEPADEPTEPGDEPSQTADEPTEPGDEPTEPAAPDAPEDASPGTEGEPGDEHGDEPTPEPATDPAVDPNADPSVDPNADPSDDQPGDGEPGDEEPTNDGEIVYDKEFITPTPDATPAGAVLGATGRPVMTPPATDTLGQAPGAATGNGIQAILLVLAGLSTMVLALGQLPAARRRGSRDGGA